MYSYIGNSASKGNHSGRPHFHFVPGFRFSLPCGLQTEGSGFRACYFGGKRKLGRKQYIPGNITQQIICSKIIVVSANIVHVGNVYGAVYQS